MTVCATEPDEAVFKDNLSLSLPMIRKRKRAREFSLVLAEHRGIDNTIETKLLEEHCTGSRFTESM